MRLTRPNVARLAVPPGKTEIIAPMPLAEGKGNELEPRPLAMSDSAAASWRGFYNDVELRCGPGQDLHGMRDFAAKAAEHAARIAGVLTIIEDRHATEISGPTMNGALTLAG